MDILVIPAGCIFDSISRWWWSILWFGKQLAGPVERPVRPRAACMALANRLPCITAAPGYRPFFLVAFFFAILHLGMLVLGFGDLSLPQGVYIMGLALALLALILG
jgi:hypothetical protein